MSKGNFRVTKSGFEPIDAEALVIHRKLDVGTFVELEHKDRSRGTVPMLRTWRGWMRETARHMARHGCTMPLMFDKDGNPFGSRPFNEYDAHELFTSRFLGVDEFGRRKSWAMNPEGDEEVTATMADRLWCMDRMMEWAAEKGINLTIPRNSQYEEERRKLDREAA